MLIKRILDGLLDGMVIRSLRLGVVTIMGSYLVNYLTIREVYNVIKDALRHFKNLL